MKHAILVFLAVFTMFIAISCDNGSEDTDTYQNPVFEPVLADPSIIRAEDGTFYAYGTEDAWEHSADNRYVPIVKSDDLVNWDYVGEAFDSKPDWKSSGYLWAPDIQHFNDQYYLYYSLSVWDDSNPGIGVATADSPEGPFEDQGKVFDSEEIGVPNSIDPYVHTEDDGTKWMFWGSFNGIYAIELDDSGMNTVGEKTQIAGDAFEATYIVEKDDQYYFFGSTGSCCSGADSTYEVKAAKSDHLLGPYEDRNGKSIMNSSGIPVLTDGEQFVGNGHNSVIQDDAGDYWLIYHGIDKDEPYLPNGATRRPLMIDKIEWDSEGWPKVESFTPSEEDTEAPAIND